MQVKLPRGVLTLERTHVMGILNTTPDSFYDGGSYTTPRAAVTRALQMVEEGVDVIDIGGERAGPGDPVTVEQERRRVIPVIEAIRGVVDVPISVDTRRASIAAEAMQAGASILNSITGFVDEEMRGVARDTRAAVIIMHIQGQPRVAHPNPQYGDVVQEVAEALRTRAELCIAEGIEAERIVIDPGPGFGKTTQHDLDIMRHLEVFASLPYPVMLAVSRKKFIGDVLCVEPNERLAGSLAVVALAVQAGIKFVRTHDVRATRRVCVVCEAVLDETWQPTS